MNLIGQYVVQKYFLIRKFSKIDLCEVITYVYLEEGKEINFVLFLVEYTWHILETNVTLQKIGFKSYLHF